MLTAARPPALRPRSAAAALDRRRMSDLGRGRPSRWIVAVGNLARLVESVVGR
jgi:hypothetical protein